MADVKVDIAEDQEKGESRVMVSGGNSKEGIVLKNTIEGGLMEACRRAEDIDLQFYGVSLGGGVLPLLRAHLGMDAVAEDD